MYLAKDILDFINKAIGEIEYPNEPRGLYAPIEYTLEGSGKRIRPVLMLATCVALGGKMEDAINQAIGLELFHNFTLLHDDVMDKADMRRGKPTVHVKWNDATAILSGDAMLTMSSQYMCRCAQDKLSDVMTLFNNTAMEIYEGQQYDMDFETRIDVTVDEYLDMIRLKTSVLLGCACEMGAIIAGADKMVRDAFYQFGVKLGLAFQLKDDYLDTYGNPEVFGKKIGGDILNDKKTWLLITALNEDKSGIIANNIDANISPDEKISKVKGIYNDLNLANRCQELIYQYATDAISELEKIELPADAKSFFVSLAENSCHRTH